MPVGSARIDRQYCSYPGYMPPPTMQVSISGSTSNGSSQLSIQSTSASGPSISPSSETWRAAMIFLSISFSFHLLHIGPWAGLVTSGGCDVLVEVEHVARVVGDLQRPQQGELRGGVGARHAGRSLVGHGVDVHAGGERLQRRGIAPCGCHPLLVLGGVRPVSGGDEFERRAALTERAVGVR